MGGLVDLALAESVLRALTPVLLAALGGLLCTKVGVFNIGLEGFMLTGCFSAVAGSWFTGSPWAGVLCAVLAGALLSLVLAIPAISFGADPIIVGLAINLFAVGMTSFLLRTVFGQRGTFQDPALQGLPQVAGQSPLMLFTWALVAALVVIFGRTVLGFRMHGVGESEPAARSLGINTVRVRYGAVVASGALCGLAGAQLALGNVVLFTENMTAGRGWVAVVVVLLGRALPIGTLLAGLLFALTEAVGYRLQGKGYPSQFTTAVPYVITLLALVVVSVRTRSARGRDALGALFARGSKPAEPAEPDEPDVPAEPAEPDEPEPAGPAGPRGVSTRQEEP